MTKSDHSPEQHQEWRFYGRRVGKKMTATRQKLIDDLYPQLAVPLDKITKQADLDPTTLFPFKPEKLVLEIGFGGGERLAEHLKREPNTAFIGAEPFSNGMSSFLKDITDQNTIKQNNVRVHMDDVIPLAKSFTDQCFDTIMVLNPDPWHKVRHHKRRIINQDNLTIFSRILKPGGSLIMTTDVRDLIEWMVTESSNHSDFEWTAQCSSNWKNPPLSWIGTKYETKGAKGADRMHYLFFKKKELA